MNDACNTIKVLAVLAASVWLITHEHPMIGVLFLFLL